MLIRTNQIKREITPLSVSDQWLEDKPHRKAENMTGQFVSDKTMADLYRTPSHLFEKGKPKEVAAPKRAAKKSRVAKKTYTRKSSGSISFRADVVRYQKDLAAFETRLRNKELIRIGDFGGRSHQTIFKMIRELRNKNIEVLTVCTSDKTAIGWILEDTLEGLKHG